jgi:endonuclease YncB( thermonuclease family)
MALSCRSHTITANRRRDKPVAGAAVTIPAPDSLLQGIKGIFLTVALALVPLLVPAPLDGAEALPMAGRVAQVIDGDTLVLEPGSAGRREVRLVGIQAPKLPLDRPGFEAWPLAEEARQALADLVLGRAVTLDYTGRATDRHRRLLAHVNRDDGLWIQGDMLTRGLARVYTFADNRERAAAMLDLEGQARAARRGLWADPSYGIRQADGLRQADIGTFQLVEGQVLKTARVKDRVYLNYGADWRSDFTVSIRARDLDLFDKARLAPLGLKGRTLRVRGWLEERNGPAIEASHPEQIEVLPAEGG